MGEPGFRPLLSVLGNKKSEVRARFHSLFLAAATV